MTWSSSAKTRIAFLILDAPPHYSSSILSSLQRSIAKANELGLGINAGHDLDLQNLKYFSENIPGLLEVSIGHALICDAIYLGLENTVQLYKRCLQ